MPTFDKPVGRQKPLPSRLFVNSVQKVFFSRGGACVDLGGDLPNVTFGPRSPVPLLNESRMCGDEELAGGQKGNGRYRFSRVELANKQRRRGGVYMDR